MPEQSVSEYRLSELERQQKEFRQETRDALKAVTDKLDSLPDRLDQRYALKDEVKAVDAKVEEDREAAKTRKTGNRALTVTLVGVLATAAVSGLVAFFTWIVTVITHVQNLGGNP